MKQCPKCRQIFHRDALKFCRFDGSPLVNDVVNIDDAPTIPLPSPKSSVYGTAELREPARRNGLS